MLHCFLPSFLPSLSFFSCFSRYQIFTDVTKEQYFSSNFSLAYEYALAGILGVDYNLELYRTTSYTFVSNRIDTTVEVFCDEDNNVGRYYALLDNIRLETFSKVMFKQLHYPVLLYTILNYPNVKEASESPRESSKKGLFLLSLSFLSFVFDVMTFTFGL
jgi:hypothetical protein